MAPPSGARVTIEELLEHASWVKSLARQLIGSRDAADDLVQDTWLSALEHPPRNRTGLTGWLRTLMRRRAARIGSDDRARLARESRTVRRDDASPAADLVTQAEGQRLVVGLVLELPEPYRSTLLLRYFGGMSFVEIAEQTGTPDATVRVHHQRALDEIRQSLAARGKDDPGLWRSVALLAGAGTGVKTAAAATATVGVLVMSAKAKLGLAAGLVVALATMLAIWSPWKHDVSDAGKSVTSDAADVANARAGGSASDALARAASQPSGALIRPKSLEAGPALFGRVVDADGAPVGGAIVVAYPSTMSELILADARDRAKGWPRVTKTDGEGIFAIGDLVPSPALEIVASAEGWQSALRTPAVPDEPIVLTLGRGVALRGRVRDFGGAPIAGAELVVNETSGLAETRRRAKADAEGRYEVRGLGPQSRFFIEAGAAGFATQWIKDLPLPDAAGISTKDFYLGRGAEMTVVAVDAESGAPLANARVLAWAFTLAHGIERAGGTVTDPKHVRILADVRTGADGRARLAHIPSWGVHPNNFNQRYNPDADLGGIAAIADGHATASKWFEVPDDGASLTMTLRCQPAASLTGRVVDESGTPLAGAQIWCRAAGLVDDEVMPGPIDPQLASLKTDVAGAYLIPSVPSSTTGETQLFLSAWIEENIGRLYDPGQEVMVRVSGTGTVRAPDLVLKWHKGTEVRLRVLDPAGAPLWGARIDEDATGASTALALTDREGRAVCAIPAPEDPDAPRQQAAVFVRSPGFVMEPVPVGSQPAAEIVVRLRRGQVLAGRVVHPDGSPADAIVTAATAAFPIEEVFPPGPAPRDPFAASKDDRAGWSPTDASGHFEIRDLNPGKFHLEASIAVGSGRSYARATLASVQTGSADLVLTIPRPAPEPQGTLTVNVRERGTKRPVMRCLVSMQNAWRKADPSPRAPGVFVADGLAPGRWTVTVRSPLYAAADPVDVTIPEDQKPVTLDVELERGITMRGRLKVAGVALFVDPRGRITGPGAPSMTVASDGAYTATGLKAGASYDVEVTHHPVVEVWDTFVTASKVVIPDQAPDVVDRDLDLAAAGVLSILIKAPRLFDPESRSPQTDEQWRIAQESRVMLRAVAGTWSDELRLLRGDHQWRIARGRYLVRVEVPGADPQEQTVAVDSEIVSVEFSVP